MNWDTVLIVNVATFAIFSIASVGIVIHDLVTGRYKRIRKLERDMTDFEQRVKMRRKKILREDENHD